MFCQEKPETAHFRAAYASRADFCEVFERDMKPLYLLAFLLTANHEKAERCFAATLEESMQEQSVFKGWERLWIKRSLLKNAIRMISPASTDIAEKRDLWQAGQFSSEAIDAVTDLAPLTRFVFVMLILERCSVWECAVLLGCSTRKVAESRLQALRGLPESVKLLPVEMRASCLIQVPA